MGEVCPWRGFTDPLVAEVLMADRAVGEAGSPAMLLYDEPPNRVYQGLIYYRMIRDRITLERQERERKKRERNRRKA